MTVSTTTSSVTLGGNGSTTVFPFAFIIPVIGDEKIAYTDANGNQTVLAPNQYTVSGFGNPAGGTVTYPLSGSPIASGTSLTISRILPLTQGVSLTNQGPYLPAAVEGALDNLTMIAQQLQSQIGRVVTAPLSDPNGLNYTLPPVASRANEFLGFDGSGNVVAMPGPISQTALVAALVTVFQQNPSLLPASVPSGTIIEYSGSGTPAGGYLPCNGSAVSRTAYPALNALAAAASYASPYGPGDGSTTFNVPNRNGLVGVGSGGGYTLGQTGGETTHTLVTAEMPSHQHTDTGHGRSEERRV